MPAPQCPECHLALTDIRPWFTGNVEGLGDPCERGMCPKCNQVWLQNPTTGAMKLVRLEPRCPVCDSSFAVRERVGPTSYVHACPDHPEYSLVLDYSNRAPRRIRPDSLGRWFTTVRPKR
jgi:hypothetical protein